MSMDLDLDFQEYTPTNSGRNRTLPQQPEVQVRIPQPADSSASSQNSKSVMNILQNVANFSANQSSPGSGLTDEALQQLIWLSERQRNKQQRSGSNNWGLGYLAEYFDVTTDEVLQRLIWSAIPVRKKGIDFDDMGDSELTASLTNNQTSSLDDATAREELNSRLNEHISSGKHKHYSYVERFIQSKPDFYGPFWISTTLIFAVAIFSNIASFKKYRAKVLQVMNTNHMMNESSSAETLEPLEEWHYSMDELNMTASVVICYVTLLPTFLWFLFWFRGCAKYYTLSETICAYGYSLSIFIPLSLLLMIQATFFKLLAIIVASVLSGTVLVLSFLPVIRLDPNRSGSYTILFIVPACHFGLAYILHRIMLQ